MAKLSDLTNGLSVQVIELAQQSNTVELLLLGQQVCKLTLEVRADLLKAEQDVEEREAAIAVAIAANKELSNDFKRKAAKAALSKEDSILEEATERKQLLEQQLSALEFVASQYQVLTRLLTPSVND